MRIILTRKKAFFDVIAYLCIIIELNSTTIIVIIFNVLKTMQTTIEEKDGCLVAYLEGRLDTAAAPQTEKDMAPLLACDGKDVVLDCAKLEYISSSGLRIFLSVLKSAKPKGSHVYIRSISNELRNVFAMTGFTNLFEFK